MTPQAGAPPPQLQIDPVYGQGTPQNNSGPSSARGPRVTTASPGGFSPAADPFNPFGPGSPVVDNAGQRPAPRRNGSGPVLQTPQPANLSPPPVAMQYSAPSPSLGQAGSMMGVPVAQAPYAMPQQQVPPHLYQAYMYQMYQQNQQNVGAYQA